MSEDEKQNRNTSRKVEAEQNSKKTMDTSDGRFYYKVVISSWKEYNSSSLQQVVQNYILCNNY